MLENAGVTNVANLGESWSVSARMDAPGHTCVGRGVTFSLFSGTSISRLSAPSSRRHYDERRQANALIAAHHPRPSPEVRLTVRFVAAPVNALASAPSSITLLARLTRSRSPATLDHMKAEIVSVFLCHSERRRHHLAVGHIVAKPVLSPAEGESGRAPGGESFGPGAA